MACTGSGVQIPSAPQILVKFLYIKEIYLQTKELISSQFLIAIIAVLQVSYVVKQLGVENFGMVTLIITLPSLIFRATHSRNSDVTLLALKKGSNVFTESIIFDFLIGLFSFSVCFLIFYSELGSYFGIKEITPVILLYLFSRSSFNFLLRLFFFLGSSVSSSRASSKLYSNFRAIRFGNVPKLRLESNRTMN